MLKFDSVIIWHDQRQKTQPSPGKSDRWDIKIVTTTLKRLFRLRPLAFEADRPDELLRSVTILSHIYLSLSAGRFIFRDQPCIISEKNVLA